MYACINHAASCQSTKAMSIRTRALVFSTFFGSCIAIGLLLVSLTTNHWVRAYPKRINSTVSTSKLPHFQCNDIKYLYTNLYIAFFCQDSKGDINFGLFYGNKDLNYGFGVRTTPIIG